MDLNALNNITPYTVNNSLINQTTEIGTNLVTNANTTTDGYFGLGIMTITFIFLLLILMFDQEVFRLRFSSALLVASGFSTLIGITLLLGDMVSVWKHVMWFAIIFAAALVLKFYEQP